MPRHAHLVAASAMVGIFALSGVIHTANATPAADADQKGTIKRTSIDPVTPCSQAGCPYTCAANYAVVESSGGLTLRNPSPPAGCTCDTVQLKCTFPVSANMCTGTDSDGDRITAGVTNGVLSTSVYPNDPSIPDGFSCDGTYAITKGSVLGIGASAGGGGGGGGGGTLIIVVVVVALLVVGGVFGLIRFRNSEKSKRQELVNTGMP
jgi:hypothetical protein